MRELRLAERINLVINQRQPKLFHDPIPDLKEKIEKLDGETLKTLYFYSLSDDLRVSDDIIYFLTKPSLSILDDPVIERIFTTARRVRAELHRFKGFMRFREVEGGYLYGSFRPDYNIIVPLSRHFAMRLREERLVIHDRKRNLATFCYQGKVYEAKIEREIPNPTEFERSISKLWLKYFETVGIKERKNRKLQRQKVPLKYRSSIIEFNRFIEEKE